MASVGAHSARTRRYVCGAEDGLKPSGVETRLGFVKGGIWTPPHLYSRLTETLRLSEGTEAPSMGLIRWHIAMAVPAQWYRENAKDCARRVEQSRDPLAKAAYLEMVRAWVMLAECAEQLANAKPFIRFDLAA
jgi:hypothetical protein